MGIFLLGLSFYLITSIAIIFIIYSLENKKYGGTGATFTMILLFTILHFSGLFNIHNLWEYVTNNIQTVILFTLSYIFIGVIWSFIKWYYYLINFKEKNTVIELSYIPKVHYNKGRIISWMTYWPLSAAWTLINDPFRRLYNNIFARFENIYQKISDSVFKK